MKSTTERIAPERERELRERIVDFLNRCFSDDDLYDILHHILGMEHEDGILEPDAPDFARKLQMLPRKPRTRYRIDHISWWKQELPNDEEYAEARKNLERCGWQINYIITHYAPTSIALAGTRHNEADRLTDFLQEIDARLLPCL